MPSSAGLARRRLRCRPRCRAARPALARHVGKPIAVGIRPEALDEPGRRDGGDGGRLRGRVQAVEALGAEQLVHVEIDAKPVLVEDVLEGLVDMERGRRSLAEIGIDTDGSARDRRRPARGVGERPARRADRACGRPPPPPLLRSRQRRGDRCLRRRPRSTTCGSRFSTGRPSSSATSAAMSTAFPRRPASSPRIRAFCRARC